jgi:GGDEF domain-containing protein
MPDYRFSFVVRGINPQKAGVISQRIEQRLNADDVAVSGVDTARVTASFRVLSVDTQTKEVFDETVEATDEQAARDQVTSSTRVVAMVRGMAG